jgi:hypothetical protein
MPTVLRVGQYRFFFYSEEGREPRHVHIEAAEKRAKFWLLPVEMTWNDGFRSGEIKEIERIVAANIDLLLEAWNEFFAAQ